MPKQCEQCKHEIPDDFLTPLCLECYAILEAKNKESGKKAKEEMIDQVKKNAHSAINSKNVPDIKPMTDKIKPPEATVAPVEGDRVVTDPNYQENPEKEDKDQILANIAQFIYSHDPAKGRKGKMLWTPTRLMYNYIRDYCVQKILHHPQYPKTIIKPTVIDVCCGCGVGTNILSQEADFAYGIDKNVWSIEFAQECFARQKNGIYYSAQESFDVIDVMTETREFMDFSIIVAIEAIEHIADSNKFIRFLIQFCKRDKKGDCHLNGGESEWFISTPNRNSKKINKDKPKNPYHVFEATSEEFFDFLSNYFEFVELLNCKGEKVERSCNDDIILAHCKYPLLS